ncbi:MAG: hypothetical protein ACREM2_01525 [Vulcanimicrobiaceae bacterium]
MRLGAQARIALSALLLIIALVGIALESRDVRAGFSVPQTRLEIAAYALVALYALVSIAARVRELRAPKRRR